MYRGVYINLDRAVSRRERMEQRLETAGFKDFYERFSAIDGNTITYGPDAVPGTAAIGCTLSHLSVVKNGLEQDRHLHILEDDAVLHPDIGRVFEQFLSLQRDKDWDLLMTDIFLPPDLYLFKYLHKTYLELSNSGSLSFLDIGSWEFAGASSYFVNKNILEKFLQLMEHEFPVQTPYDLRIRELARHKSLKVFVCFPFFSTVSEQSSESTIAGSFSHVLPLTEYRRCFYVTSDHKAILKNLDTLCTGDDDTFARIYLGLMKCLVNPQHTPF